MVRGVLSIKKRCQRLTLMVLVFWSFAVASADSAIAEDEKFPFKVPADYKGLPSVAIIETTKGTFEIKFYRKYAPISVANFQYVARRGTYTGVKFHRYEPGMLIQGGDPTGTKKGGMRWTLPPEITGELHHGRGTVGWARLDEKINPERRSNSSQFYITLRPVPGLDGFYTIFAQVIRGMEIVDQLRPGDQIIAVRFSEETVEGPGQKEP
jgi:peptidyl-prolyl cis-trans isomerase B (cyclophilin B)